MVGDGMGGLGCGGESGIALCFANGKGWGPATQVEASPCLSGLQRSLNGINGQQRKGGGGWGGGIFGN